MGSEMCIRDRDDLLALLEDKGIPSGRVFRAPDMLTDPQYAARDAIVEADHPVFGKVKMQNAFPKMSETPGSVRWPGPSLGEHSRAILMEAGISETTINELIAQGVSAEP